MTPDEIEIELCELDEEIEEYEQELEAVKFLQMLHYLEDEGFFEIDGEHIFLAGEAEEWNGTAA